MEIEENFNVLKTVKNEKDLVCFKHKINWKNVLINICLEFVLVFAFVLINYILIKYDITLLDFLKMAR
ncbi:MAG: hypothetical protein RR400_00790 [Clostridia bacterium]